MDNPIPTNRFHRAETITQLMYQVVGAGSMCWWPGVDEGDKVFDSSEAAKVANDALIRMIELGVDSTLPNWCQR